MRFENQTFNGVEVTLDYNQFFGCTLENCVILHHGGDFHLEHTKLTNVRFAVGGPGNAVLSFLRMVRSSGPNGPALLKELLDAGPQPEGKTQTSRMN